VYPSSEVQTFSLLSSRGSISDRGDLIKRLLRSTRNDTFSFVTIYRMIERIQQIIKQQNILSHDNQGILVAKTHNTHEGFNLAKEILYALSDTRTMLYLSGGRTPKELYKKVAEEEMLEVGAVGLIDERFGEKFHDNSNEKMLQDAGLLRYLQAKDVQFYPILSSHPGEAATSIGSQKGDSIASLQNDESRRKAAAAYDTTIRELNNVYQKNIGILGVGLDGHTAGLPAGRQGFQGIETSDRDLFSSKTTRMVTEYNDENGQYGERVTMTFLGLSMLDLNIVLVFGDDKKDALNLMFSDGPETDVPSRFFKRPDASKKTVLITDQTV